LTAFGLGIAFPTVFITVTAGIPARQQGVAGGLFVTAQQADAAVGLAAPPSPMPAHTPTTAPRSPVTACHSWWLSASSPQPQRSS
jgi:hypothetical protein